METEVKLESRIKGGIYGLLIGDALGVPYEFQSASSLPPLRDIEFEPPPHFVRSHGSIPPGTWSDDGAQALVLLESLLDCNAFDLDNFAVGLLKWRYKGHMAVDGVVFDVGNQTQNSLAKLSDGISPELTGGISEDSNGNGSLMRVLPLALWHKGSDKDLVKDAFRQSSITHNHTRSKLCCAIYCLWARAIIKGSDSPWEYAIKTIYEIFPARTLEFDELEERIRPQDKDRLIRGSGYVADSLFAARWANTQSTFEATVKAAISLGDDTDTTACVAGGIAGLINGFEGIPERWIEGLRGKEYVEPLVGRLIARLN